MSDWVVVESTPHEPLAQIWASQMEGAGIPHILRGNKAVSCVGPVSALNTSWGNPLGGIELCVRSEDVEAAREVLKADG